MDEGARETSWECMKGTIAAYVSWTDSGLDVVLDLPLCWTCRCAGLAVVLVLPLDPVLVDGNQAINELHIDHDA